MLAVSTDNACNLLFLFSKSNPANSYVIIEKANLMFTDIFNIELTWFFKNVAFGSCSDAEI